jgi:hypothetical protein
MIARAAFLPDIVRSMCGDDSGGRAGQAAWLRYLHTLPTLESRYAELEHFLRTFARPSRHGSKYVVKDHHGYVGKQHGELVPIVREVIDPESGEVLEQETGKFRRAHVPADCAGAIAARMLAPQRGRRARKQGKSPRQCNRYRRNLRRAGIMSSTQPPKDAKDAKKPRSGDGRWAYAQHWLLLPPTPAMIRRWGHAPAPTPAPAPERPRGPSSPVHVKDELAAAVRELLAMPPS